MPASIILVYSAMASWISSLLSFLWPSKISSDLSISRRLVEPLPLQPSTKYFTLALRDPQQPKSVVYILSTVLLSERSASDAQDLIKTVNPGAVVVQVGCDAMDVIHIEHHHALTPKMLDIYPTSALHVIKESFLDGNNLTTKYMNMAQADMIKAIFGTTFTGHVMAAKQAAAESKSSFYYLEGPANPLESEVSEDLDRNSDGPLAAAKNVAASLGSSLYFQPASKTRTICFDSPGLKFIASHVMSSLEDSLRTASTSAGFGDLSTQRYNDDDDGEMEYECPAYAQSFYPFLADLYKVYKYLPGMGLAFEKTQKLLKDVEKGKDVDFSELAVTQCFRLAVEGLRVALNSSAKALLTSDKTTAPIVQFDDLPYEDKCHVLLAQALKQQARQSQAVVAILDAGSVAGIRKHWMTPVPDHVAAKRPTMVRGETSGQAHPHAVSQHITTGDALSYLKAVKDMFKDKKGKYDEFLEVMKDFKAQRINTSGVITRVKELFKGHRDLILGFNTFLPRGYEITLPLEEEPAKKQPVEFNQAISYVNKIKTRFQHDEHIYKAFLEILYMYRKRNKSINEVYEEVAALFREHQDLLEEFTHFLPNTSGVVHPLPKMSGNFIPCRDDKDMPWPVCRQSPSSDKFAKRENMASAQPDRHRSADKHADRANHGRVGKADKDQRKKEREKKDERDQKETDHAENDSEDEQDSDGMQQLPNKHKSTQRADDSICKQSQAQEGGEASVGPPAPMDEKKVPKILQKKLAFFERVKSRLGSHETYQEFLKCINMYTEEIISRTVLHNLVEDLLGSFPDLVDGFSEFFTFCESNEGFLAKTISKKLGDGCRDREKDKERDKDKDGEEGKRNSEKEKEKDKFLSQVAREAPNHRTSLVSNKEKFSMKPISELDLSTCECCTPSYRLLPKSYPKPVASLRSKWAHLVLNDKWVSVTSGSEDYSFKHMRKNQYEESLFRCEDDRFELDMLLETTAVTAKRIEELLEKMQEANGKQDAQFQMEHYLKAIHLRCIERIYGDHGLDVIDLLRKNVVVALPVILSRLEQKHEEWSKCRADMNKIWAEVYAKNYHKSLDHRSFYFKQQDKKSLSTKALLAEIKEISEKKRRGDDVILSIAAGNTRPYGPDLNFEYPDTGIHDDLYQIIKYSSDEMCASMEQSDKIMRLWTAFLEPFFGVPTWPQGTEDTEEVVKIKPSSVKASGLGNGESDGSVANGRTVGKKQQSSKHSASPTEDHTTASSKTGGGKIGRSDVGVTGSMNEATLLTTAIQDMKVENLGSGSHAGNAFGASEDPDGVERHGNGSSAQIPLGVTMSTTNDLNSDQDFLLEKELRRENEMSESKVDAVASKCSSGDITLGASLRRLEREEGELSPSPEVGERKANNGSDDNTEVRQALENKVTNHVLGDHAEEDEDREYDREAEGEHDADADDEGDESAQKTGEDSENGSEPGEDVSGTESGDGDDSPEDHEDDEDEDEDEQQQGKNESEGEVEGMADAHDGEGDGTSLTSWDRSLLSCMPLTVHGPSIAVNCAFDEGSTVFYGNDTLYVLFRLHQTLYERILSANTNAKAAEQKWKSTKDMASPDLYEKFMRALYNLLDGSADNAKFEDDCRAIIGTQSYVLFTLDKLIYKLVKQLQAAASDEMANKLLALHSYEKSRPSGGSMDVVYHANACGVLHDENIYKFERTSNSSQLSIQLMEDRSREKLELIANAVDHKFSKYLDSFLLSVLDVRKGNRVFLARNKHHYAKGDEHTGFTKAMENVLVANGLEYKISCSTSKVSYVLDTRDFFFRKNRKRKASSDRSVNKFHQWLASVS